MLKFPGVKPSARLLPSCAADDRLCLIEEKVRLEAKQEKLLNLCHQDKSFEKLLQAKEEKNKKDLHICLQNQLADNRRRVEERKSEENDQDRQTIIQMVQKLHEKDAETNKPKDDEFLLLKNERATCMAIKNAWEKKYKEALKLEDENIARIIAKKEIQQKKLLNKKVKY